MKPTTASPRRVSGRLRSAARRVGLLSAAVAVAVATGCVTTAPLEPPEVDLVNLEFVGATVFESTLDVAIRISNDNPEPLILDGMAIKLELEGRTFGKGSSADRVELPRLGSVVHRLTVHVNHIAVATRIREVVDNAAVSWAITGRVWVVTPDGATRRFPVERQGVIDLRNRAEADPTRGAGAGADVPQS